MKGPEGDGKTEDPSEIGGERRSPARGQKPGKGNENPKTKVEKKYSRTGVLS